LYRSCVDKRRIEKISEATQAENASRKRRRGPERQRQELRSEFVAGPDDGADRRRIHELDPAQVDHEIVSIDGHDLSHGLRQSGHVEMSCSPCSQMTMQSASHPATSTGSLSGEAITDEASVRVIAPLLAKDCEKALPRSGASHPGQPTLARHVRAVSVSFGAYTRGRGVSFGLPAQGMSHAEVRHDCRASSSCLRTPNGFVGARHTCRRGPGESNASGFRVPSTTA
jgi:hypothetical protein